MSSTTTTPDPILIAAEIFCAVSANVINSRSKPWALKTKEAEAIADAALDAAEVFCERAAKAPEPASQGT